MAYLNCPRCARRLRVPDDPAAKRLRCPACGESFASGEGARAEGAPAPADSPLDEEGAFVGGAAQRILSQADEAMLRDYGSGSGLLELTREAYSIPSIGEARAGSPPAPGEAPSRPAAPPPASPEELDRQFQIIGTALTLANKLVLTHKTELARTRRLAALAWALVASLAVATAASLVWAVRQIDRGDHLAARLQDANLKLAEGAGRESRLADEVSAARGDHQRALTELKTARDAETTARVAAAEKKAESEGLSSQLKAAVARAEALAGDVQRLQTELALAKAAADAARAAATMPTTDPAPAAGSAASAAPVPGR